MADGCDVSADAPVLEGLEPGPDGGLALGPSTARIDASEWEPLGQVTQAEATPAMLADAAAFAADGLESQLFDGEYEAMLVLADGTAFGRSAPPKSVPNVSPAESVGVPPDYQGQEFYDVQLGPDGAEQATASWVLAHASDLIAGASAEDRGDLRELTAGAPPPQSVLLGADDRWVRSNTTSLTSYPWRTVGSVLYSGTDAIDGGCTATKIGPRHAITAAHCLHDCNGTWFSNLYFSPGQQGDTMQNGGPRAVVARYARTCTLSSDYGLIVIADSSSFASLGWVGYNWWNDLSEYVGKYIYVAGYPQYNQTCTDSPRGDDKCGGYMYYHYTQLPNVEHQPGYIYHSSDTTGGQSGSSVLRFVDGLPHTLGQHKRGNEPGSGATVTASPATYNIAARMRSTVWDDICSWIGAWPSQYATHPCQ